MPNLWSQVCQDVLKQAGFSLSWTGEEGLFPCHPYASTRSVENVCGLLHQCILQMHWKLLNLLNFAYGNKTKQNKKNPILSAHWNLKPLQSREENIPWTLISADLYIHFSFQIMIIILPEVTAKFETKSISKNLFSWRHLRYLYSTPAFLSVIVDAKLSMMTVLYTSLYLSPAWGKTYLPFYIAYYLHLVTLLWKSS